MSKLVIFYSGSTSGESLPERVLADRKPGVMLTYYEIFEGRGDTIQRFERHAYKKKRKAKKNARKKRRMA